MDAACGLGGSTRRLAQTYAPEMITGINISEAQIADARALAPGCTFEVMNATELDFPDDHFDGVICIEGACHFDTRDEFFKEAHRVLKPGGSLALADMLFGTTILSEFGQVPRANLLTSIAEYRVRLAAAGFVSIEVTDATEHCLGGFRANLARWAGVERRAGRMTLSQSLPRRRSASCWPPSSVGAARPICWSRRASRPERNHGHWLEESFGAGFLTACNNLVASEHHRQARHTRTSFFI